MPGWNNCRARRQEKWPCPAGIVVSDEHEDVRDTCVPNVAHIPMLDTQVRPPCLSTLAVSGGHIASVH